MYCNAIYIYIMKIHMYMYMYMCICVYMCMCMCMYPTNINQQQVYKPNGVVSWIQLWSIEEHVVQYPTVYRIWICLNFLGGYGLSNRYWDGSSVFFFFGIARQSPLLTKPMWVNGLHMITDGKWMVPKMIYNGVPKIDGLWWSILSKWMILGYHPF